MVSSNSSKSLVLLLALLFASCSSIPDYDQVAYDRATELKADAIRLVQGADTEFAQSTDEVESLRRRMEHAYEYEKGKGDMNVFTVKQYEIMMDPDGGLLYGFLARWEREGKVSSFFAGEVAKLVGQGFDEIIRMEWNKR